MLTLLGIALFVVILIIIASAAWIIHYMLVKLPEQQDSILNRYSGCVVNQIALEYAMLPSIEQRRIAAEKMRDIFMSTGTMLPGDAMIEASISDALYHRKQREADLWIEELIADQISQTDTAEMPVTPREEFVL